MTAEGKEGELPRIRQALDFVRRSSDFVPQVHLVLGSGLGSVVEAVEKEAEFPLSTIPHFPRCTVVAHDGKMILGTLNGVRCLVQCGRFHLYEGYSAREVVRPVRLARLLGAETLIITNAAGGIRPDLEPGDLMLLSDHLNLTGENPLRGDNEEELGPRFPDMTHAYDPALRELVGAEEGDALPEGVYAGLLGPTYETPAEIRMLRALGADAVGMSTVCEVIAAVHSGMRVLGVSCITNKAAGLAGEPLSHDDVLEITTRHKTRIGEVMLRILERIGRR